MIIAIKLSQNAAYYFHALVLEVRFLLERKEEELGALTSACFPSSDLSEISVIISLHFEVKHFAFCVACLWNKVLV